MERTEIEQRGFENVHIGLHFMNQEIMDRSNTKTMKIK